MPSGLAQEAVIKGEAVLPAPRRLDATVGNALDPLCQHAMTLELDERSGGYVIGQLSRE